MAKISRDDIKKRGLGRFVKSFGYSIAGLVYAYKYEQSMFIHFLITFIVVVLGILLHITASEWLIIFLVIGLVLAAELLNTAIEAVVDMVTLEYHPLAKIAKDCGSAATFILAMMAAVVGLIIFIPHIMELLGL